MLGKEQSQFCHALMDANVPAPGFALDPLGNKTDKRFNVYRNNVHVSLTEAVAAAYPVVEKIVGEEFFRALAQAYVIAFPPRSPVMILYGEEFADFLTDFPPAQQIPFLADVARLERVWIESYHSADSDFLTAEALSQIDQAALENVCLRRHPAVRVVSSVFPVVEIFRSARLGNSLSGIDMAQQQIAVVSRPGIEVMVNEVDEDGAAFLAQLSENLQLGDLMALVMSDYPEFDLGSVLSSGLATGWFDAAI